MKTTYVFSKLLDAILTPGVRGIASKGGTRSSKTWSTLQLLYIIARESPDPLIISCVTDTLPAVKRGMLRDFEAMLTDEGLWNEKNFNKTEGVYEVKPGVKIEFFGCENAAKVHGPARDILFINEAQKIPREVFRQLDVRTRYTVIIDFNPVRRFWGETDFVGDNYVTIHSTYKDNPYLTRQQVAAIERNKKDANWWRVYGEGLTGGLEGLIFPQIDVIDTLPDNLITNGAKFVTALDFGFQNDPAAMVEIYMHGWDLYLNEVCYDVGMFNKDIADVYHLHGASGWPTRKPYLICDNAEMKSIAELRKTHGVNAIPCIKGRGSVEAGLHQVKQFTLHVTKASTNILDEADNYTYVMDEMTGTYTNEPIDKYNHAFDAIRYGVDFLLRKYRPQAATK